MHLDALDTPAVIADLAVMERNIAMMAAHCREVGIPLRVHTKSHKIPEIAHKQLAAGAIGIACQKLGEAEVMVAAGVTDILIPYNIVGPLKVERLTRLAKRATITVAVDSEDTARGISDRARADGCTVRVIVELDIGTKRCGVQSPEAALALAKTVVEMPGLEFIGLMLYPSRLEARPFLERTLELLGAAGIPVRMISGGGTGAEAASKQLGCTETRSGSYIWEGMTRIGGSAMLNPERCAGRVVVTVVSLPTADRIIIDGGMKTFASYPPTPYGHIIEHPDAHIYGMSVEHGHVDVSGCSHRFRVGERLSVIPLHQEMTLNLHDELVGVRDGIVEAIWPVAGRGKVR
ncbi:MAG: alanine racemase [Candidatus Latescibacteria bacterium]|nr:alanine racemase [Candidatus Latescibacterota bacterium]